MDDEEPKGELPKAGVADAPNAGLEEAACAPKTPVEVLPKIELLLCEPKGFGANGLLLALFACPNGEGLPNRPLDDCPNAANQKNAGHGKKTKTQIRNRQ